MPEQMSESATNRGQDQNEYLGRLNSLSEKIVAAIAALERNDLQRFEDSLAAQEFICHELSQTAWVLSPPPPDHGAVRLPGSGFLLEVKKAHRELARLNRVYAALLNRSRRTMGMVAGLYRCHGWGYDTSRPTVAEPHTWSCEA
ncbi:MAG: hypothetical protein WBQ68_07445 [Terriglobales bacterium]